MSPSLGDLPDELGLEVLKYLDQVPDIAHLAITCRKYFRMADPILYDKAVARLEEEDTKPRLNNGERNYSIPFKFPPLIWGVQEGLQTTIQKALLAKDCLTRVHVEARNRLKPSDDSAHLRPAFRPYPTYQMRFSSSTDTQEQEEFFEDRPTVTREAAYQGRPVKAEMTALHVAAQNASPELLAFLLDHFEAIQAPVNMGVRVKLACGCARPLPLSNWVEENSAEAWENIEWGDPNGHASNLDETDCTPLHLALCAGQKDNAKLLITRGANFAYHAKLLITRDADFTYDDEFYDRVARAFSSFHFAAASGQLDVLKAMVEKFDRRLHERGLTRDQNSFSTYSSFDSCYRLRDVLVWELSPLYHAIANGHWDTTVPYLLELEGTRSINRLSFYWFHWYNDPGEEAYMSHTSLLAEFCRLGRFEEASKILDQRDLKFLREQDESYSDRYELGLEEEPIHELEVSVSPSDFPRVPFIHLCCMNSLRGAGADWVERQVSDLTMETFQEKWRPVVIKKLIALGLDPNFGWALPDDPGSTPLIVAARHGNLGAINALLDSGADVQARNEKGHNALMTAMMQRTRSGTIDKADANEFKEIPGLVSTLKPIPLQDLWDITERLLEAGIDINAPYTHGTKSFTALNMFFHPTPLPTRDHTAMRLDSKEAEFVQFLICKGANPFRGRQDPDLAQELFRTAVELQDCPLAGELARALLAAGADPTPRDQSGRYALDVLLDGLEKQPNFVPVFGRFFGPLAQGRETEGALQCKIARLRWLGFEC